MGQLNGQQVVITGALSGIGRAIAARCAREGALVTLFDIAASSRDDGADAQSVMAGLGDASAFVQGDVAEEADVDRLFAAAEARGRVDVVVSNAGVTAFKPIEALTVEDFDAVMRVNVRGAFLTCRRAIATMRRQGGGGTIVNVASNFGLVGAGEASVYCASKGAVATMTKALAVETGADGIRINALCPGATATEFNRAHRARPEVLESWRASTPLRIAGRDDFLGTPDDIAAAALFLAGDASIYMTGSTLVCDGGWNAR